MSSRNYIGKPINIGKLTADISNRDIRGVHFHEDGNTDPPSGTIYAVLGRDNEGNYTLAYRFIVKNGVIEDFAKVKFQWECGGWKSNDILLIQSPEDIDPVTAEIMDDYTPKTPKKSRKAKNHAGA